MSLESLAPVRNVPDPRGPVNRPETPIERVTNMKTASLSVAAVLFTASLASAAITSTFGGVTQIAPPAIADFPFLLGPVAQAWDEQPSVTGTIFADHIGPGNNSSPTPGVLTGTYASHFIHWSSLPLPQVLGQVNFSNPVVAVAWGDTFLDLTDGTWGAGPTAYPTGSPFRGINSGALVSVFGNSVRFEFHGVTGAIDIEQMRVWTAVPTPGAFSLAGLGGLAALRRKRR